MDASTDTKVPASYVDPKNPYYELLLKGLPLFTGVLLFVGLTKAVFYYLLFGIHIPEFIGISEALNFSLLDILTFSYGILTAIFCGWFNLQKKAIFRKNKNGLLEEVPAEEIEKTNLLGLKIIRIFLAIGIFVSLIFTIIRDKSYFWDSFLLWMAVIFLQFSVLNYFFKRRKNSTLRDRIYFPIYMIFALILCATGLSMTNGLEIKLKRQRFNVEISLRNAKIISGSDSLVYVGKVEKYVFLYNKKLEAPEVISNAEIVEMKWLPNPNYK